MEERLWWMKPGFGRGGGRLIMMRPWPREHGEHGGMASGQAGEAETLKGERTGSG